MRKRLKLLLILDIIVLSIILMYKFYLFAFERNFDSLNIKNIKKIQEEDLERFSFIVLGKIENSIDIFANRMIPAINKDEEINFMVSNGNATMGGSEDKFRILNRSLNNLTVPFLVGIGEKEVSDNDAIKFYKHFGPFYFSFTAHDSYFIFLDTTGQTSMEWQKEWLLNELEMASKFKNRFVFMNRLPFEVDKPTFFNRKSYIRDKGDRDFLTGTFSDYKVDAVFTSGLGIYKERIMDGVPYYITGGGGGGFLTSKEGDDFYHYLKVHVEEGKVNVEVLKMDRPFGMFLTKPLERFWITVHSLFYTNMSNFFLIVCVLVFLGIIIYVKVTKEVNYYGKFDHSNDEEQVRDSLTIAMFTNNYFPFIGGVPISIYRLAKGLRKKGHTVYIFAPDYPLDWKDDVYTIRCKLLMYLKTNVFHFTFINIFSPKIENEFLKHDFDVIHVHHPFWMGRKGLELGKKYDIPVVLTHHTRLDSYSHYIPFMRHLFQNVISHQMIKEFAQKCTAIFSPTETSKVYLANIGVSRLVEVLPTGIDLEHFKNVRGTDLRGTYVTENELLLCSVSRLSKEKNIYFLIECLSYIKTHTNIPFKCILIGDGPEREEINLKIEEAGLQKIVILLGNVPPHEVPEYYMASDVFVFASKSETQGMVLLEAMAGRCPIVAVSSSGIEDMVVNGHNGYKTVEDVEVWSERVMELLKDTKKIREMSENAYCYAEKFSLEAMADRASKTYKKAIKYHRIYDF